jgi:hypothetical protein
MIKILGEAVETLYRMVHSVSNRLFFESPGQCYSIMAPAD